MPQITPTLDLADAQFVIDILNQTPLPGIDAKIRAVNVMNAFGQAPPYEPEEPETEKPAEPEGPLADALACADRAAEEPETDESLAREAVIAKQSRLSRLANEALSRAEGVSEAPADVVE